MTFAQIKRRATAEWEALHNNGKPRIYVGTATCGRSSGALKVLERIRAELQKRKIAAEIIEVGCIGCCYLEPLLDITKPGRPRISYSLVTPDIAAQLVEDYIVNDNPRPDLALGTIGEGSIDNIPSLNELPVFKPQVRIALRNCGYVDPGNINHYIARGGYSGLARALEMSPEQVIAEVEKSAFPPPPSGAPAGKRPAMRNT